MIILRKIIAWIKAFILMPMRIANVNKILTAISSLLILKEINPALVKELIPSLPLPPDVLSWDVHQRYKRENAIATLEDMVASQISGILRGCKSLPWRLTCAYGEMAMDSASFSGKPSMFDIPMRMALVDARDVPLTLELGEVFETLDPKITKQARFRNTWMYYIAALLSAGNEKKAIKLLIFHAKNYSLRDLERMLAVAHFAHNNNLSNERIKKSAFLYEQFKKNTGKLEALIDGKRVAVVGNGPYELGQGKGREIDSHDLVIRFGSCAQVDDKHQSDYGTRTDINVWGSILADGTPDWIQIFRKATFVYVPHDVDTSPITSKYQDALDHCLKNNQAVVAAMPGEFYTELVKGPIAELDIGCTISSGARFLAYLKQIMGDSLTLGNIYGFAFKYAAADFNWRTPYHYDAHNLGDLSPNLLGLLAGHNHNFLQEARLLRRLFCMKDDSFRSDEPPFRWQGLKDER